MTWFLLGLFLGGMVGVLVMALCRIAADSDRAAVRALEMHHEESMYGDHPRNPKP